MLKGVLKDRRDFSIYQGSTSTRARGSKRSGRTSRNCPLELMSLKWLIDMLRLPDRSELFKAASAHVIPLGSVAEAVFPSEPPLGS